MGRLKGSTNRKSEFCKESMCNDKFYALGWCISHYNQLSPACKASKMRYNGRSLWGMERWTAFNYAQGGLCYICGQTNFERGVSQKLASDHNHETGQLRGLLCINCNRGLGMFEDDVEFLESAVKYLTLHGERSLNELG